MRMANSTACSLSTGSAPGRPRQVGQMLTLGSSPNALRHPQNSLVVRGQLAVDLEPDHHLPCRSWRHLRCARLEHPGHPEQQASAEGRGQHLHADGQAVVARCRRGRTGPGDPRGSTGWCRRRSCTSPSGRPPWPRASKAVVGAVAPSNTSKRLVGPVERLHHERAHPLRLRVVGVVVAGGEGVGPEHDASLDLGTEAGRARGRVHGGDVVAVDPRARSARRRSGPGWTRPRPERSGSRPRGRSRTRAPESPPPWPRPRPAPRPPGAPGPPRRARSRRSGRVHRPDPHTLDAVVERVERGLGRRRPATCCRAGRARPGRRRAARRPPPCWRTARSGPGSWRRPPARSARPARRSASCRPRRTGRPAGGWSHRCPSPGRAARSRPPPRRPNRRCSRPAPWPVCRGLRVGPKAEFSVELPMANSSMLVLPSATAPARRNEVTTVAS